LFGFITDVLEELVSHLVWVVGGGRGEEEGGGGETYLREVVSKDCYTTIVYVAVLKMHIGSINGNKM
jgi:hypothetical protein